MKRKQQHVHLQSECAEKLERISEDKCKESRSTFHSRQLKQFDFFQTEEKNKTAQIKDVSVTMKAKKTLFELKLTFLPMEPVLERQDFARER